MMIHHIREIQLRLLAVVAVLLVGMGVGYVFYEPLFAFLKAPLNAPLHYMSPVGSFTFIIKICLTVGVIVALPVTVYNLIMFIQPAFSKRLSRLRVYLTTLASLVLAGMGAAFAFLVILPLALRFFSKFQVDGLVAIISADEYLRFVLSTIVTFVLIFQLPLLISFIDHVTPLPPKKLLKAEKYIIVGSVFIGVIVPFALDPTVQMLIATPIIILYNLSIVIVLLQHARRRRKEKPVAATKAAPVKVQAPEPVSPAVTEPVAATAPAPKSITTTPVKRPRRLDGMLSVQAAALHSQPVVKRTMKVALKPAAQPVLPTSPRSAPRRLITDIRPTGSARLASPPRPFTDITRRQAAE